MFKKLQIDFNPILPQSQQLYIYRIKKLSGIKNISTLLLRVLIFTKRTQKCQTDTTIMLYIKDAEGEESADNSLQALSRGFT